jgi:PAS domain S-box-containing protein
MSSMSSRYLRQRWRESFGGPPLTSEVRAALAKRIVGWLLTPFWLVAIGGVLTVLATTGLSEPTRLYPVAILLPLLGLVTYLSLAQRWLHAAGWLCAAMFSAAATGVLLNGVHAPVYGGLSFILLAVVISLFGNRWGALTVAALVGAGALWMVLDRAGLALAVSYPTASMRFGLIVIYMALVLITIGGIQRLLADALHDAQRKHHEAQAAREAEAASELAFHAVFDQASVGLVLLTAQGVIAQLNHRAAIWLGARDQDLIGRTLEAAPLWSAEQRALMTAAVSAAARGSGSRHELTVLRGFGAQFVYQVSISPFHTLKGALGHVIVEVVEVSDLVQTRAQLAQARRLEALGKLSGGVAHDINNMLAAIRGNAELVRRGRDRSDPAEIDTGLYGIEAAVLRASALTKQLLAFGRQNRFASAALDLNELVRGIGQLLERTLAKSVAVQVLPSDTPAYIEGDSAAIEHALLNLALNAQDAMPNGGTLTLAVQRIDVDDALRAKLQGQIAAGPAISVRVTDTGTGMSDAVRERLFEPFFTTKPLGKGTGLGLAAVHGTVCNHRGAIAVSSQEGLGSSFELLFPEIHRPAIPEHSGTPERAPPPVLHARVLLADDEPLVRDALVSMLTSSGCQVQVANDGTALIDALAAGASPDVIVTDLVMPGLSGKQLVRTLELTRPGCPLLLITGFTGEDVSEALSGRSRHRLLRKPFGSDELLAALADLLADTAAAPAGRANSA